MHVGVLVLNKLPFKTLDLVVVAEVGVSVERAVTLDLLGHGTCANAPVVIDVPLGCDATAIVGSVVEVVFYKRGVIRLKESDVAKICDALLETAAEADFSPIGADRATRPETRAFRRSSRARDIIDIAAFLVGEDHTADRKVIAKRNIQHGIDVVVGFTVCHGRCASLNATEEARRIRFVGDQAHHASLRARTKQCALRTREHLYPVNVSDVDIEVTTGLCHRLLVEIERHIGAQTRYTRGGQVRRGRRDTANIHGALTRTCATG